MEAARRSDDVWVTLEDLRQRHQSLARKADSLRRLASEGKATVKECEDAEQKEREAYAEWRRLRVESFGGPAQTSDRGNEKVPRDI